VCHRVHGFFTVPERSHGVNRSAPVSIQDAAFAGPSPPCMAANGERASVGRAVRSFSSTSSSAHHRFFDQRSAGCAAAEVCADPIAMRASSTLKAPGYRRAG
jgi:hypothetical protein